MVYRFGELELDEERFELRAKGQRVHVEPKVLELLFLLVKRRSRVVTKREIFEAIWPGVRVSDASLARAAMEARKAIDDTEQSVLVTVRGKGLRFAAEIEEVAAVSSRGRAAAPAPRSPYVGRDAYAAALAARLEEASAGRGSLAWLSGEAGIGKTRALEEFAKVARARGATVISARGHEGEGAPPFWPWLQIARMLPDAEALERALVAGEETRFQRFDVFCRALTIAVQKVAALPVVVTFDDLQWADTDSLELLVFVARATASQQTRLLIVAAHRDVAPGSDERARVVGKLLGESTTFYLPLRGLTKDEVARLTEQVTNRAAPPGIAAALYEKSAGNPLYLRQILQTEWAQRALSAPALPVASSIDLKPELLQSIGRHLEAVSPDCRAMLTVAAVLGREFSFAALSSVAARGAEEGALLALIDEAISARVILTSKIGYRFAHALVRDVVYKKLGEVDKVAQHRAVAEGLLAHYGDTADLHAAELAHHFSRAAATGGTALLAADFSTRAARHAESRGAHADAASHYERAIAALTLVRNEDARRLEAHIALGRARQHAGDDARAREAFLDAALLAKACRMTEALAEIEAVLTALSEAKSVT